MFFPAYNDAPSIAKLVDKAFAVLRERASDFEVIVVNDGSGDNTAQVLTDLEARHGAAFRVITHAENRGYGAALRSGFAAARKDFAVHVIQAVREVAGIVVINRDVQLATLLGAGLHLPSRELMAAKTRPNVEWCSASCHDPAELERARDLGLDFVLLSPVQATPSHSGAPDLGWIKFANLIHDYSLPVFALGGMRGRNLDEARRSGAHGVAMVRGAWEQQED